MGTASGGQGTMTGGVTAPDDVPDEPEPGIATPRGQGAPPAGQEGDV